MATTEQPQEGPARIGVVEVVEGHGGDGSEAKALCMGYRWLQCLYSVYSMGLQDGLSIGLFGPLDKMVLGHRY